MLVKDAITETEVERGQPSEGTKNETKDSN